MKIHELLNEIRLIREKYKTINSFSDNKFNVFTVLDVETKEVKTHSAFIAELLNPNGSHNLGAEFLEAFVDLLSIENIDLKSANIRIEEYVGKISEDRTEGGRIDIRVKTDKGSFIIENKINAGDQEKQLIRYSKADPNAKLFYLTLRGVDASELSKGKENDEIEYEPISYKKDIIEWLESCVKIAANVPFVRETINQYINLIKKLTGQSINQEEIVEVIEEVFKSKNHTMTYLHLLKFQSHIYKKLNEDLLKEIIDIAGESGAKVETYKNKNMTDKYWGFKLVFEKFPESPVTFEFQRGNMQDIIYGFLNQDYSPERKDKILNCFKNEFKELKTSGAWFAYENWHAYRWWNNNHYERLLNGDFKVDFKKLLDSLIKIIEESNITE